MLVCVWMHLQVVGHTHRATVDTQGAEISEHGWGLVGQDQGINR